MVAGLMPNPSLKPGDASPPHDAGNGILGRVPGPLVSHGAQQLPQAGPQELTQQRSVVLEVPGMGAVRITYALNSYKRGRSRHWHWLAVRADHQQPSGISG